MADASLNYAFVMERFIEQRAKTPEKAAEYLAITVNEINEILRTGNVSVKTGRALNRMVPNLDLTERSEEPYDFENEEEIAPVSEVAEEKTTRQQNIDRNDSPSKAKEEITHTVEQRNVRETSPKSVDCDAEVGIETSSRNVEPDTQTDAEVVTEEPARDVVSETENVPIESARNRADSDDESEGLEEPGDIMRRSVLPESGRLMVGGTREEGTAFLEASERIKRAEESLDRKDESPPFRLKNTASLAAELVDDETEVTTGAPREGLPPFSLKNTVSLAAELVDDDKPEAVAFEQVPEKDTGSGLDDGEPDFSERDTETEVELEVELEVVPPDTTSVVETEGPGDITEAVEGAIDAAISSMDETAEEDPPDEIPQVTEVPLGTTPEGTSLSVVDGVELIITMPVEEAEAIFGGGAESESPDDRMLREIHAERDAEEQAAARTDIEFDNDFEMMLNEERLGDYIMASLRRHARWVAFQQKHSAIVKSYPDREGANDADPDVKSPEGPEVPDVPELESGGEEKSIVVAEDTSLVGSAAGRRKVIQQGRKDPTIVMLERVDGEQEFYGENGMAAVDEWRGLQMDYMRMQSRRDFNTESSKTLLCRDKILAVEIYLIEEHSLTIKRPQAPEPPKIWDEFKRNEEIAVRLNVRTGLIEWYKQAREDEQREAAVDMLKGIPLAVVKAPFWVVRKATSRVGSGVKSSGDEQ